MNPSMRSEILEIEANEALERVIEGVPVYDLRSADEQGAGRVKGARSMPMEQPEQVLASDGLDQNQSLLVCCASGRRSLETVQRLRRAGYRGALSIRGGFSAWLAAGLPCEHPGGLTPREAERYARHLSLPEVGISGQARLLASRVLIIGAGGLGSPAALYLAAAGVGCLGLVDHDTVERSNLQRQLLHTDAATGEAKTASARERLAALNPDITIETFPERLAKDNVERLLSGWHLVLDGSDNLPTRYLLNAACVSAGVPLVYGGVTAFEGQVSVFHPGAAAPGALPCYACVFPEEQARQDLADCTVAGVLGVLPGLVGVLQATEAIKVLLGIGRVLTDRLLLIDALDMAFRSLATRPRPGCPVCAAST